MMCLQFHKTYAHIIPSAEKDFFSELFSWRLLSLGQLGGMSPGSALSGFEPLAAHSRELEGSEAVGSEAVDSLRLFLPS